MAVRKEESVTIDDKDGKVAYELRLNVLDEVSIQVKQVGFTPPKVKREDLIEAVAQLGRSD